MQKENMKKLLNDLKEAVQYLHGTIQGIAALEGEQKFLLQFRSIERIEKLLEDFEKEINWDD